MGVRRAILAVTLVLLLSGCAASDPDDGNAALGDGDASTAAESGVLTGQVTALGTTASQAIALHSLGHERLAVILVLVSNVPETSLVLNVTGPAGRSAEVSTGPLLYALPGNRPAMAFNLPEVGDWTASVQLESGASADYEVHWCADDATTVGPADNLACQRDY